MEIEDSLMKLQSLSEQANIMGKALDELASIIDKQIIPLLGDGQLSNFNIEYTEEEINILNKKTAYFLKYIETMPEVKVSSKIIDKAKELKERIDSSPQGSPFKQEKQLTNINWYDEMTSTEIFKLYWDVTGGLLKSKPLGMELRTKESIIASRVIANWNFDDKKKQYRSGICIITVMTEYVDIIGSSNKFLFDYIIRFNDMKCIGLTDKNFRINLKEAIEANKGFSSILAESLLRKENTIKVSGNNVTFGKYNKYANQIELNITRNGRTFKIFDNPNISYINSKGIEFTPIREFIWECMEAAERGNYVMFHSTRYEKIAYLKPDGTIEEHEVFDKIKNKRESILNKLTRRKQR